MKRSTFIKSIFASAPLIVIPKATKPYWGSNRKRYFIEKTVNLSMEDRFKYYYTKIKKRLESGLNTSIEMDTALDLFAMSTANICVHQEINLNQIIDSTFPTLRQG
jgi:hypothetical protein